MIVMLVCNVNVVCAMILFLSFILWFGNLTQIRILHRPR